MKNKWVIFIVIAIVTGALACTVYLCWNKRQEINEGAKEYLEGISGETSVADDNYYSIAGYIEEYPHGSLSLLDAPSGFVPEYDYVIFENMTEYQYDLAHMIAYSIEYFLGTDNVYKCDLGENLYKDAGDLIQLYLVDENDTKYIITINLNDYTSEITATGE